MIIDAHVHLLSRDWLPETWWSWLAGYYEDSGRSTGLFSQKSVNDLLDDLCDPDAVKLIRAMDEAGVDKSVVLPLDYGLLLGEPRCSIEDQNTRISQIVKEHESRLIGFVGIDPNRPEASEVIEHGVRVLGMKGVKLHPGTGFDPESDRVLSVMAKIAALQVPVIVHTGHAYGPLLSKYCQPTYWDKILATYPTLNLIAAHLGGGWFNELCGMSHCKPNLYTDISLAQLKAAQNKELFKQTIRNALDSFGPKRILFGSDWPFSENVLPNKIFVKQIKELLGNKNSSVSFSSFEIKGLLGKNYINLTQKKEKNGDH